MSDFDPRRAKPGDKFTTTGADGAVEEFEADGEGVVRPTSKQQELQLDKLGVPRARKVMANEKAEAEAEAEPVVAIGPDAEGGKD